MKKLIAGLISLTLTFSMVSCSDSSGNNNNNQEAGNNQEETVVDSASETAFSKGEQYFNDGDYASAIKSYEQVAEGSPNYETAQERIQQANEEYKNKIIDDVAEYAKKSEYKNAISVLEEAIEKMPDDNDLKTKLEEINKERCDYILEETNEMVLNDDYVGAIDFITKKEQCADTYPEVAEKLEEYTAAYVKKEIESADGMVKDGDYDGAIEELGNALTTLPSNEELTKKKKELEDSKPVPLSDFKITNSEHFEQITVDDGAAEDSIGNVYAPGNLYKSWEDNGNGLAEIYVGKEYTKLSGICATSDECTEATGRLEIYADDKMIYSQKFNRKSTPFNIDLDITNCEWLKIQVTFVKDTGYGPVTILLSNFSLYK